MAQDKGYRRSKPVLYVANVVSKGRTWKWSEVKGRQGKGSKGGKECWYAMPCYLRLRYRILYVRRVNRKT